MEDFRWKALKMEILKQFWCKNKIRNLYKKNGDYDMKEYIDIAEKYLVINSNNLTKGICFTIRYSDLKNSNNPEQFIKEKISSICYDFSAVRDFTDEYGTRYLLFYND